MNSRQIWQNSFNEAKTVLEKFSSSEHLLNQCEELSKLLCTTFEEGSKVFACGNGGSHCDAMHFSEELTGRYRKDRPPMGALALGDPSHTTCVANDYGFEQVFSRQLGGLARNGDLLLCLSTSGNSKNLIAAVETAKKLGVKSAALLGRDGGELQKLVDLAVVVPAETSDRIQEMHIKIIHTLIESVERRFFPENYS